MEMEKMNDKEREEMEEKKKRSSYVFELDDSFNLSGNNSILDIHTRFSIENFKDSITSS
jgi:hypothetical protein